MVIPALDAAATLPATLAAFAEAGPGASPDPDGAGRVGEVIVVDGGSADATAAVADAGGAVVLRSARGRGTQIAAGIAASRGGWLLLLHADTVLGPGWQLAALGLMRGGEGRAGYFRFGLDSTAAAARRLERLVAWRCRWLGLPYGDQGLLIARPLLLAAGGVRALPMMEDVDLARRLGRRRLVALEALAITSARRWQRDGWRRRSARNVACLALYLAGLPPRWIARLYG